MAPHTIIRFLGSNIVEFWSSSNNIFFLQLGGVVEDGSPLIGRGDSPEDLVLPQ